MNAKTAKTEKTAPAAAKTGNSSEARILEDESKRNIRPLGKDEKPISKTVVNEDGNTVEAWYSLGTNKDIGKPHQGYTVFDFSGCSKAELLDLASRSPLIAVQRRWSTIARSSGTETASKPGTFATVDVKKDIVNATRQSAPPMAKADKLINSMSEADKRALMAKLETELNGSAA